MRQQSRIKSNMADNIYICAIEDDGRPRRIRETVAVEKLVGEAFGPFARKYNLPTGAPAVRFTGSDAAQAAPVFSISHSLCFAALAVSPDGRSIGVDIESFRPTLRRVAAKFLNADEASVYATDEQLLLAWTLKEATYKAAGTTGLPLHDIHLPDRGDIITLADGRRFHILHTSRTPSYTLSVVIAEY